MIIRCLIDINSLSPKGLTTLTISDVFLGLR